MKLAVRLVDVYEVPEIAIPCTTCASADWPENVSELWVEATAVVAPLKVISLPLAEEIEVCSSNGGEAIGKRANAHIQTYGAKVRTAPRDPMTVDVA